MVRERTEPKADPRRRDEVLRALKAADSPLGVAQIAESLGVHPNTVRFHLDALLDSGQAERVDLPAGKPGRPPLRFRARPGMNPGGPRNYRLLAEILASQLMQSPDPAPAALEAGKRWGRAAGSAVTGRRTSRPGALGRLVDLLDEFGFAPEESAGQGEIALRHCPFLDLADSHGTVVCPMHLGLMRGFLDAGRSPVTVERLEPFAEPDRCLVRVGPHSEPAER